MIKEVIDVSGEESRSLDSKGPPRKINEEKGYTESYLHNTSERQRQRANTKSFYKRATKT